MKLFPEYLSAYWKTWLDLDNGEKAKKKVVKEVARPKATQYVASARHYGLTGSGYPDLRSASSMYGGYVSGGEVWEVGVAIAVCNSGPDPDSPRA